MNTVPDAVSVPSGATDRIESRIARDVVRKAVLAGPVAALGAGLWRGPDAGLAVGLALAVVVASLMGSAAVLGWSARQAPHLLVGVALLSFVGRLVVITAVGAGLKALDVVDWPVFCIALVVGYLALLFWEMRSISLSLAYPGLKPRKES